MQAVSAVGDTFPLHCTANGKAALALLPDDTVNAFLHRKLPALTRNTLTTASALKKEIAKIRAAGIAYDREEHTVGISAIAQLSPLLDYVDMDGALLLADDPAEGVRFEFGKAIFPEGAGTGARLRL